MLFDPRKEYDPVRDDLLGIADFIRTHGWCQKLSWRLGFFGYRYCLDGSVREYVKEKYGKSWPEYNKAYHVCSNRITQALSVQGYGYMTWNDQKGRKKEEVIELVERAAAYSTISA
jgi:hypothetical protein